MWLIDVHSYKLKYFQDTSQVAQKYAILSHRWEDEEVSHSDMTSRWDRLRLKRIKGWYKIQKCCEQAAKEGLHYAWVDTCCIDKTSSAELQEAINSMFAWYSQAKSCYVFLSDVKLAQLGNSGSHLNNPSVKEAFRRSQWFTRGWTLQELLAPKELTFYDCDWRALGTRSERKDVISDVTGIDDYCLNGFDPAWTSNSQITVAQVMIWASGRKTTRVEDKAYSLLGVFGVSMPMLYGEGAQAFFRLQEQLLRTRDDQSIFAWTGLDSQTPIALPLTDTPDDFVRPPPAYKWIPPTVLGRRKAPVVTSDGITLQLLMHSVRPRVYHALLNTGMVNIDLQHLVTSEDSPDVAEDGTVILRMFALPIQEVSSDGHFMRLVPENGGGLISYAANKKEVCRLRSVTLSNFMKQDEYQDMLVEDSASFTVPETVLDLWSFSEVNDTIEAPQTWPFPLSKTRIIKGERSSAIVGLLTWNGWPHKLEWFHLNTRVTAIAFGYDFDFNPTCVVVIGQIAYDENGSKQLQAVFEEGLDESQIRHEKVELDSGTQFSVRGGKCGIVTLNPSNPGYEEYRNKYPYPPELMVFKTITSTRWSGKGFRAVIPLTNSMYDHYYKSKIHISVSRRTKKDPWEINIDVQRQPTKIISHAINPYLTRFVAPRPAYRLGTWAEHGGEPGKDDSIGSSSTSLRESD